MSQFWFLCCITVPGKEPQRTNRKGTWIIWFDGFRIDLVELAQFSSDSDAGVIAYQPKNRERKECGLTLNLGVLVFTGFTQTGLMYLVSPFL